MKQIIENESGEITFERENNITTITQGSLVLQYEELKGYMNFENTLGDRVTYELLIIQNLVNKDDYKIFGIIDDIRMFSYINKEIELNCSEGNNLAIVSKDKVRLFEDGEYIIATENDVVDISYFDALETKLIRFMENR